MKSLPGWLCKEFVLASGFVFATSSAVGQSARDGFDPSVNGGITVMALQADGKSVIAGDFTAVGGAGRSHIARLNVDGTVDAAFNPGADLESYGLVVQADGKIVVGGYFSVLGGQTRMYVGRLNADGSLDIAFDPGADGPVLSLAVQPDGKIIVGGNFSVLGGKARDRLARLNADGTVDDSFNPGVDDAVWSLTVQADGKILVGGDFLALGAQGPSFFGRLNADGSLDAAFAPLADSTVFAAALQADGKIVAGGDFSMMGGQTRLNLARLNAEGSLDPIFNPGADNVVGNLIVQPNGKILVAGGFLTLGGQSRKRIARLNTDGTVDNVFNPGASGFVGNLALQSDEKVVVTGTFTNLAGEARNNIGRLYSDGMLDTTLNLGADEPVRHVAIQPDNKILVAGLFTTIGGRARHSPTRLNADGTLDLSFNSTIISAATSLAVLPGGKILVGGYSRLFLNDLPGYVRRLNADGRSDSSFLGPTNFDDNVDCLAVQADGKILVGGNFTSVAGQSRAHIGRLNADGSLEAGWSPGADDRVLALAVQEDGKILVGGLFHRLGGLPCSLLGRLNPNGTLDTSFSPAPGGDGPFAPPMVLCLALQPDGKILVGGYFTMLAGQPRPYLGRLNSNGGLDTTFNTTFPWSASVSSVALQADGRVLVAGQFENLDSEPRRSLARLNADGSVDKKFISAAGDGSPAYIDGAFGLAVQTDGKIILVGSFTTVNGEGHTNLARLTSETPAMQAVAITPNGAAATWTRSGSAPEVQQVIFEESLDGTNYRSLGNATRTARAWVVPFPGVGFPSRTNFYVRARGRTIGGQNNGSSGLIESVAQFWRLPSPFINSVQVVGQGVFQFSFTNTTVSGFTIWATSALETPIEQWESLGAPAPVGGGVYQFTDPGATNFARRFYQLRSP